MEHESKPPVDVEAFRATMREAGIEEIVDPTLDVFVKEAERIFHALEGAFVAGDLKSVGAHAHSLKSSSGNIWALGLSEVLATLEAAANSGEASLAAEIFERVRPEYAAVMAHLLPSGEQG
jgi:HPt (histidine-containing phosphotransfer) domain-containing protein